MKVRTRIFAGCLLLAACLAAGCGRVRVASAYTSHVLCSSIFISHLDPDQVYAEAVRPMPRYWLLAWAVKVRIDWKERRVRTTVLGFNESTAQYRDGLGCTMLDGPPPAEVDFRAPGTAPRPALPPIAGDALVEPIDDRLRDALEQDFRSSEDPLRRTKAIVVVKDGKIVAERYAPGYGMKTQLVSWSLAKSVTSALVGILVREGKLALDQPAGFPEWSAPSDPRRAITVEELLRMESGLEEIDTDPLLFLEHDMAAASARVPLAYPPGTRFHYSNVNYHLLSRIVRELSGGRPGDALRFARDELFGPLGMEHATFEVDAAGTFVGTSFLYASARDFARFGVLYANDGIAGRTRILPEGWVRSSRTRTLGSAYGAGFWIGRPEWRARYRLPDDLFFAAGILEQRIVVVPSEKLVIVRCGVTQQWPEIEGEDLGRLIARVREATAALRSAGRKTEK